MLRGNIMNETLNVLIVDNVVGSAKATALATFSSEHQLLLTAITADVSSAKAVKASISLKKRVDLFGYEEKDGELSPTGTLQNNLSVKNKFKWFNDEINNRPLFIGCDEQVLERGYFSKKENVPHEMANLLRAAPYGFPILMDWESKIYDYFIEEKILTVADNDHFGGHFSDYELGIINKEPEDVLAILNTWIQEKKLEFPEGHGSGEDVWNIDNLDDYLKNYNELLMDQVTREHKPLYDHTVEPIDETLFRPLNVNLFTMQKHSVQAMARALSVQKGIILQGEMSIGKTFMLASAVDVFNRTKGKDAYKACIMCPPQLNEQWGREIKKIIPDAEVYVIHKTDELIKIHQKFKDGILKEDKKYFFVISFTVMRNSYAVRNAVNTQGRGVFSGNKAELRTFKEKIKGLRCPTCGAIQTTEKNIREKLDAEGNYIRTSDITVASDYNFSSHKVSNRHCVDCGDVLFTPNSPRRFAGFKDWVNSIEKPLIEAIKDDNMAELFRIQDLSLSDDNLIKGKGKGLCIKRIGAADYISRRMKNFFDVGVIDEVHECKAGNSNQGVAAGQFAAACKKVIAGTGTLIGGYASDVYFVLCRIFPELMIKDGYDNSSSTLFEKEFGNIETKLFEPLDDSFKKTGAALSQKETTKKVPGISPFVYSRYLMQSCINLSLDEVWEDPVKLENHPTTLVEMSPELEDIYKKMSDAFEDVIGKTHSPRQKGMLTLQFLQAGVSLIDNPFTYPDITVTMDLGNELETIDIFKNVNTFDDTKLLPKEEKFVEIVKQEKNEKRPVIVYVTDTGSTNADRDLQPRLKKVCDMSGIKAAVLRSNTTKVNKRTEWIEDQINNKHVDVIILNMDLVKVGVNLTITPTIIFYQLNWSLFTLNQAARRHWRIGQTQECRTYYLAYQDTFQESRALLVAKKNRATEMLNGKISSDGLSQMLGDEGDILSVLLHDIQSNHKVTDAEREAYFMPSNTIFEGKKEPKVIKDVVIEPVTPIVEKNKLKQKAVRKAPVHIQKEAVPEQKNKIDTLSIFDLFNENSVTRDKVTSAPEITKNKEIETDTGSMELTLF